MREPLDESTVAATPPKVTRNGGSKPPPRMSTVSPPCGLPVLGETEEM